MASPKLDFAKRNSSKVLRLPKSSFAIIDHYFNLKVFNNTVSAVYYINETKEFKSRVKSGKGRPEEIQSLLAKTAKKHDFTFERSSKDQIRKFMFRYKIGIDCSGFVVWILNELVKEKLKKPLWSTLDFEAKGFWKNIAVSFRPVENISANLLTNDKNSIEITELKDILPGDMLRTWDGGHVMIIIEVGFTKKGMPTYFRFVHSSTYSDDGKEGGVREGYVVISNPKESLLKQSWVDTYANVNWAYEGFRNKGKIVRLKALN